MDFSPYFISDPSFSHLNAGTRTRVPLSVIEYMERERRESEKNPTKAMFLGYDQIWDVQKRISAYLHASPHEIFLRSNVTAAFNDFLFALPVLPKGELLATGWEYGGILGAAEQWAAVNGHSFRSAPLGLHTKWTQESIAKAVIDQLKPETRVLLVSHVATGTGAVLPVKEIAKAARQRGVITVVDGAHAVGALEVNLSEIDADFYGGNFHKWFLGPEGTGFGWIHPNWENALIWKFGGWARLSPPGFYQNFGDKNPETCRRFFPGTIDRLPFLGLGETLSFWEKWGAPMLRSTQRSRLALAAMEALKLGWTPFSPTDASTMGPLVCFERPPSWEGDATSLATRLYKEAKVQVALPEVEGVRLIRFSPGVYSTEEEIRTAFVRLGAWRP